MDHFSAVYDLIALTRGGNLSEEQQLVLDHEKLFFYEPLPKAEEDTIFEKMFLPWITSRPDEKLKGALEKDQLRWSGSQ